MAGFFPLQATRSNLLHASLSSFQWFLDNLCSFLACRCITPFSAFSLHVCLSLCPNFAFLERHYSYWIKVQHTSLLDHSQEFSSKYIQSHIHGYCGYHFNIFEKRQFNHNIVLSLNSLLEFINIAPFVSLTLQPSIGHCSSICVFSYLKPPRFQAEGTSWCTTTSSVRWGHFFCLLSWNIILYIEFCLVRIKAYHIVASVNFYFFPS